MRSPPYTPHAGGHTPGERRRHMEQREWQDEMARGRIFLSEWAGRIRERTRHYGDADKARLEEWLRGETLRAIRADTPRTWRQRFTAWGLFLRRELHTPGDMMRAAIGRPLPERYPGQGL